MQYTPTDGLQLIHTNSFTPTGSFPAQVSANIGVAVYIQPIVIITIDHIGGPNVGLKATLLGTIGYDSSKATCPGTISLNLQVALTLGADIDIAFADHTLYQKSFAPALLASWSTPLVTNCFGGNAMAMMMMAPNVIASDVMAADVVPTSTFHGIASCNANSYTTFCVQYLPDDYNNPIFVGSTHNHYTLSSTAGNYHIACVLQQYYIVQNGKLEAYPTPAGDIDVQVSQCPTGYKPLDLSGSSIAMSSTGTSAVVTVPNSCFGSVTLAVGGHE
jgi:hypothetical protein